MASSIREKQRVIVELPYNIYRTIEKLAYIRGSTIENTIVELTKTLLGIVEDIDSHYSLKYSKALDHAYDLVLRAVKEGKVKLRKKDKAYNKAYIVENYVKPLGVIATILVDLYGKIPKRVSKRDLESRSNNLEDTISRIAMRGLNPIKYILNKIEKIKPIAPAFDIEIIESEGNFELVFGNTALLENLYGVGTRPLRRRIKT
ncbi:MAG: hypothetical protein QXG64_03840 [Acidilobaceae archaeon]